MCDHKEFQGHVTVNRLEDRGLFMADVQVRCVQCKTRFRWLGLPRGLSFSQPMISVDGFELRGPIEPDGHMTSIMADHPELAFPTENEGRFPTSDQKP